MHHCVCPCESPLSTHNGGTFFSSLFSHNTIRYYIYMTHSVLLHPAGTYLTLKPSFYTRRRSESKLEFESNLRLISSQNWSLNAFCGADSTARPSAVKKTAKDTGLDQKKGRPHSRWRRPLLVTRNSSLRTRHTMPENPIKAIASRPAVSSAIGMPFIAAGTFRRESCSRMPAKMTSESAKPIAVEKAKTMDCGRL